MSVTPSDKANAIQRISRLLNADRSLGVRKYGSAARFAEAVAGNCPTAVAAHLEAAFGN